MHSYLGSYPLPLYLIEAERHPEAKYPDPENKHD